MHLGVHCWINCWCILGANWAHFWSNLGSRSASGQLLGARSFLEDFFASFMYPIWVNMGLILGPKLASINASRRSADSEAYRVPEWELFMTKLEVMFHVFLPACRAYQRRIAT